MLRSFSAFILFALTVYLVVRSDAKCHRRRKRNCCCNCEEELGSTNTPPSSTLPPSSSSSLSSSSSTPQQKTIITVKPTTTSLLPSSSSSQKLSSTFSPSSSASSSSPPSSSTLPKTTTMKPSPPCVCECNPPTNISKGIPIIGNFYSRPQSKLGQCSCNNSNYYTTEYVSALETPSGPKVYQDAPFSTFSCNLCLRTPDDIYYTAPQNSFAVLALWYYCVPNSDPQDCAFYATFYPPQGQSYNVTLVSVDGKNLSVTPAQYNADPLGGPASSYLKVVRASCAGCAILTADTCSTEGTLST